MRPQQHLLGIRIMVVQRTLTPPVGVRSSHPQPNRNRSSVVAAVFFSGCSADGSALGSGPRGRGFESRHSDQKTFQLWLEGLFLFRTQKVCGAATTRPSFQPSGAYQRKFPLIRPAFSIIRPIWPKPNRHDINM